MLNKKRLILPLALPVIGLIALSFLPPSDTGADADLGSTPGESLSGNITISGDSRMVTLSRVWAVEFMRLHPGVVIKIADDASSLTALSGGTAIYQAMPQPVETEIEEARAAGIDPYQIRVASDALSVIRWYWNPVELLTVAQVSAIYSGKITNWKELGGDDAPIVVYAMPVDSEAYNFFKSKVLRMVGLPTEDNSIEFGKNVIYLATAEEGNDLVADNANAIFFTPVAAVTQEVTPTWIARTAGEEPSKACLETTTAGIFPIYQPLFYYTDGEPTGAVESFIDYILSEEGQSKVMLGGYLRLFYPVSN